MIRGPFVSLSTLAFFCSLLFFAPETVFSQKSDPLPDGVVPPPLNVISKKERSALDGQIKMRKRTQLAIEMMESRLLMSETAASKENYPESLNQLGRFQALIRYTFVYLKDNEGRKGSIKNFKKFEMSLKKFITRLELLRRELPYKYGYHVREMMNYVLDARTEALEPFFENTVIPQGASLK